MALEQATFAVNLRDNVTRHAAKMAMSVRRLRKQMSTPFDGFKASAVQTTRKLNRFRTALDKGVKSFKSNKSAMEAAEKISDGFKNGLLAAKDAIVLAGAAAGVTAAGIAALTVQAVDFNQRMGAGFSAVAKHGASATRLFDHARHLAEGLGADVQGTTQQFMRFLSLGFNPKMATDLIKAGADFRAFGATGEEVSRIFTQLGQIKSAGVLQGDELRSLAENGLNIGFVYDAIGEKLGKTRAEVIKLKEAGKITDDLAFAGIFAALSRQTGGKALGEMGKEMADATLSGLFGQLKGKFSNTFIEIAKEMEPALMGALGPLMDMARDMLASPDFREAIKSTVGFLADGLKAVVPFLREFGSSFVAAFKEAAPFIGGFIKDFFGQTGGQKEWMAFARDLGQVFGTVAPIVGAVAAGLLGVFTAGSMLATDSLKLLGKLGTGFAEALFQVSDFFANLDAKFTRLKTDAIQFGSDLVDGFIVGFKSKVQAAVDAVSSFGKSILGALGFELDINSPSKEFGYLGKMSGLGYMNELRAVFAANDNLRPMVEPMLSSVGPVMSSASVSPTTRIEGGGGAGGSVTMRVINHNTFKVQGWNADEIVAKIEHSLEARMVDVFERLAAEVA